MNNRSMKKYAKVKKDRERERERRKDNKTRATVYLSWNVVNIK